MEEKEMKLENILKLEKHCDNYDDSYCFAKDEKDGGLTCQNCVYGNELIEKLLEYLPIINEE